VPESLTRVPVALSGEWISKTVTTDPPRYTPHLEWRYLVSLHAPTPVRAVVLMRQGGALLWGLVAAKPDAVVRLGIAFFAHDWTSSDAVQVSFGWQRATVVDAALKADPRSVVSAALPSQETTGNEIPVLELPSHDLHLATLVVVEADTERRRLDRWRIKSDFAEALAPDLAELTSGHQHGRTTFS
jgi:hypothetical protein